MEDELRFPECNECINDGYQDGLVVCAANKLRIALHNLGKEIPWIRMLVSDSVECEGFAYNGKGGE